MSVTTFEHLQVENRRVLLREDLNVPFEDNTILSDVRIVAALETIRALLKKRAKVILMSHLGRPDGVDPAYSLQMVADKLSHYLKIPVPVFSLDETPPQLAPGELALLENVRFNSGETENDPSLAKRYAALGDVFVMDAFAVAHRKHASTCGVMMQSEEVCLGPLLTKELTALNQALEQPKRPWIAIVGGGKVSSKLAVLQNLIEKVDTLIVGGAIANTFLKAKGYFVGASRIEADLVDTAKAILETAEQQGKTLWLPSDVVVARDINDANGVEKTLSELNETDQIFDIGSKSCESLQRILKEASTIIWNGPMGVFEKSQFANGTRQLSQAVANSAAYSIAGGGETLAAIEQYHLEKDISVLSTGGGAFLALLEGKPLDVIQALREKQKKSNIELPTS